jgi:membrane protease subunit HflK
LPSPEDEDLGSEDAIRRSVGRILANWTTGVVSLTVIVGWAWTGIYQLEPGESAVILRLGEQHRTVVQEGLNWHYPVPIESIEVVNVSEVRQHEFGLRGNGPKAPVTPDVADDETPASGDRTTTFENAMQTVDNNIVNLGYVLKFEVEDAFAYLYRMADREEMLFDAARSAVREVVGKMTVDEVLYTKQGHIRVQARERLQERLAEYFSVVDAGPAFGVIAVELQIVQPPSQVQEAFDEIIAAGQDEERAISEARGDAKETTERANAEAIELDQGAIAYRDAKILEARGRTARFDALLTEYKLAPEVTRQRLYLETMEEVLPEVDKMVIEPGAASVIPLISMGGGASLPPVAAPLAVERAVQRAVQPAAPARAAGSPQ